MNQLAKHLANLSRTQRFGQFDPPKCKCGKPCQFYGPIGGYSVACKDCNAANAKRQRIARKRKRG